MNFVEQERLLRQREETLRYQQDIEQQLEDQRRQKEEAYQEVCDRVK